MKQFQCQFKDFMGLKQFVFQMHEQYEHSVNDEILFHIYSEILDKPRLDKIKNLILTSIPSANIVGVTTNGNICNGILSDYAIMITCTIFEKETTKVMIRHLDLYEDNIYEISEHVKEVIKENPWIKMVELLTTMRGVDMAHFCDRFYDIQKDVQIFGGGAFSDDIDVNDALVLSTEKNASDHGVVFVFVGGEDFHLTTSYVTGWKALGRAMEVTGSCGNTLKTLDNTPAYQLYYKYLNIENNQSFFHNTLEFPFLYNHNGISLLRAPISANKDDSIVMTSGIEEGSFVKIAYGDPQVILKDVQKEAERLQEFQPQAIVLHSCAARKFYWNGKANAETGPFQRLAPTFGFYTSGEFLRTNGYLNQHNVTLVIAAMREGDAAPGEIRPFHMKEISLDGAVSMVSRMATFINATTKDLTILNHQLLLQGIQDGLTKLLNRTEIQKRVNFACEKIKSVYPEKKDISCIMIDVDNFKQINDNYGHNEGDIVLIGLSQLLKDLVTETTADFSNKEEILGEVTKLETRTMVNDSIMIETLCGVASVGRWGGEEFLILLPDMNTEGAYLLAEKIRKSFSQMRFEKSGQHTISLGVTSLYFDESPDSFVDRADRGLYDAKKLGKNRVIIRI